MSSNSERTRIVGPVNTGGAVNVSSQSYMQSIAEGDIPNHILYSKLGYTAASTVAETTLWNPGTAYVFPTGAISVEAVSTSASDTSAGTGARIVHLEYLNASYVSKEFDFTMNGATPVAGPTDFFRVNSFHVKTAGSGGKTAGVVSLRLVGGAATVYSQMPIGATRSRNSVFTVPLGKTFYVQDIHFSMAGTSAGKVARVIFHSSINPHSVVSTTGLAFWPMYEAMLVDGSIKYDGPPLILPAKTDMKVSNIGEAGAFITAYYGGWIE